MKAMKDVWLFLRKGNNMENDLKKRYSSFIDSLTLQLNKMFEDQKEFIKCKKGCAHCCKEGEYPFSKLEIEYLMDGYRKLPKDIKDSVKKNMEKLDIEYSKSEGKQFMYTCPLLVNNECVVYDYRGIICRTFGLLLDHGNEDYTMPFCHELSLNYAAVYDEESGTIVDEKNGVKLCETEPKAYRATRDNIMNISVAKDLDLAWGESKTLYDYLKEYNLD